MKQLKDATTDVGKQRVYLYHVKEDNRKSDSPKLYQENAKLWYPKNSKDIRLSVLRKLYFLSGQRDSICVDVDKYARAIDCYLLFMADTFKYVPDKNIYVFDEEFAIQQTKSRFNDFVRNGFIEGFDYGHIILTLTGRNEMERLLSKGDSDICIESLQSIMKEPESDKYKTKLNDVVNSLNKCESHKLNISKSLGAISDVSSIIGTAVNLYPSFRDIVGNVFSTIRNLL